MDKQKKVEYEIEQTLNLLENMEELKPNPYLYTRVKSNLDSKEYKHDTVENGSLITKLIPALIILLILINLYSIVDLTSSKTNDAQVSRAEYLQEIRNDYMLSPSSYYPIIAE